MSNGSSCRIFIPPRDIVGALSSSYLIAITQQGRNTIIKPTSSIQVIYGAGTIAFGGNPQIQFGYLGLGDTSGPFCAVDVGLNGLVNMSSLKAFVTDTFALNTWANQPLVLNLSDATAAQAPILTWALSNAGTGYTAGDDLTTDNGSTIHIGTVNGSGVILTSSLTVNNPEAVGTHALTGGSGSGAVLNILTIGPQGNGNLYIEFEYTVTTVPFPIH